MEDEERAEEAEVGIKGWEPPQGEEFENSDLDSPVLKASTLPLILLLLSLEVSSITLSPKLAKEGSI